MQTIIRAVEPAGQLLGVGRLTAYAFVCGGELKCRRLSRRMVAQAGHRALWHDTGRSWERSRPVPAREHPGALPREEDRWGMWTNRAPITGIVAHLWYG